MDGEPIAEVLAEDGRQFRMTNPATGDDPITESNRQEIREKDGGTWHLLDSWNISSEHFEIFARDPSDEFVLQEGIERLEEEYGVVVRAITYLEYTGDQLPHYPTAEARS